MMKKNLFISLICTFTFAQAHEVWINAPARLSSNDTLKADLAYSHNFPHAEKIADDRIHIFAPLQLTDSDGKTHNLIQKGENYQYINDRKLRKGSYIISATYKPTFWSQDSRGKWEQKNLVERPEAVSCEQSQMFGKSILIVDNKEDLAAISQPIGQVLEIIPLANPNSVQPGKLLPVQILYQNKPLPGATVTATADTVVVKDLAATHNHREPQAFSGKTDKEGKVNILPLVEGLWKVKVVHRAPFENAKICGESAIYSTLIMPIGTKRAGIMPVHHHH